MKRPSFLFAGRGFVAFLACALSLVHACSCSAAVQEPLDKPLPDIPTLMRQVEANQRKAEAIERDYVFRQQNKLDAMNSQDSIKKTETREFEVFWLQGIRTARLLAKDGKLVSPDELKKENARIDANVQKAKERRAKADEAGKETDSRGNQELSFARMLELGTFTNARREAVKGRDTILVDYLGDSKAKTHNYTEGVFRELAGTVWIDEQDSTLQHLEGHFNNDFKVGGGLVMSVKKGTWFKATFTKINNEIWLPETIEAEGHARYLLLFSLNGHFVGRTGDYRKFKATSIVLPSFTPIDPALDSDLPPLPTAEHEVLPHP